MIPVSAPDLGPLEREYLLDAFDSGWVSSRGPYIERAEERLRGLTGAPFAATTSNGTTALHLALLAAGIGPGDEVILPSLTYIATLNAVYYVGAKPVIVDVHEDTWCIDVESVERSLTPSTAAILAVDLYGQPADYVALRSLADEHGVTLIADAAESIGGSVEGSQVGTLADLTTFSFFGNKVVTSGEGGAVLTASRAMHERVLQLRNQGNHPVRRYHHDILGYNYRMTNLSAALLTAQLERIDHLVGERRRVVELYRSLLGPADEVILQHVGTGAEASPWMFSVRLRGAAPDDRDALIDALLDRGVETRPVFALVQDMPFVPASDRSETPVAARISAEGLSLPTFPGMTDETVRSVVSSLLDVLDERPTA